MQIIKVNNRSLTAYSLLSFCLAFIGLPIYIYLPNYYAENFNISLQTIAIILLFTRLVDTVQDPIFGVISDKYSQWKQKIIAWLAPFLGISFVMLFYPLTVNYIEVWLITFIILTYSLFSLIYINYQSYAVGFTNNYHLKTKIIAYREVCFILGIIFAASIPSILFKFFSEPIAFLLIGLAYLVLISLFALIFYHYSPNPHTQSITASGSLKSVLATPILLKYFAVFMFNTLASTVPAVLVLFFVEHIVDAKHLVGIFLVTYFTGLLIGVIMWTKISRILNDKVTTYTVSLLFTIIVFSCCYFVSKGDIWLYGAVCFFSGIGFGGDFALVYSILTDIIQRHKLRHLQATIFGVTNFLMKLSLTLSSAMLIYIIGYLEAYPRIQQEFIFLSYITLPIIFANVGVILLYKNFKIDKVK